ncbi:TRAP transporter small permease subunit [Microbaculum sp. FT89]|uniref:TRAP transporter small permease subunit n=1 Tax=Microbaculum sp. FT89 TaxID=3447298 RepID=UPI003F5319AB
MPETVKRYVRYVDALNRKVGLFAMYLIFGMLGILFYSAISKAFFLPSLWTLEMAQFVMVAYYMLGGGYTLQTGTHVRMDLLYSRWRPRTKAAVDSVTILFLIFFLVLLLAGGYSSTEYAFRYGEESYSAWAPKMWPIKVIMCIAILLTLLQAVATFFRNLAEALGDPIDGPGDGIGGEAAS